MKKNIDLSIIIVNFNTYGVLDSCLKSIYQGHLDKSKFEIIVVDNNSKDDSVRQIKKHFPEVILIENKKNEGFAAANNKGIKKTVGEFILFLNPDTLLNGNTLSTMLKFMKENSDVGIATCRVNLATGNIDDACHRGFPTPWNALCHFSGLSSIFPTSKFFNGYHLGYYNLTKNHEIDSCAGAFMMVRRAVGDQIDWFDEDYFWYGEDLDFCYRAKINNWKVMYVPDVSIIHYKGVSSGIKEHSRNLSLADRNIQLASTKARFEVMRIFYDKHYQDKYPGWLRRLVTAAIRGKQFLTLFKYQSYENRN